jgi:uncharacterized membrane protein (UPF0127 family)
MKNEKIKIGLTVLLIIALSVAIYFVIFGKINNYYAETNLSIGSNNFSVQLAVNDEQRQLGLGRRPSLQNGTGMLFVFPEPRELGFWMKDMNFPLDIIWIDQNKKIAGFFENVSPASYPKVYYSSTTVPYVLEVNAGTVSSDNIKIGDYANFNF